MLLKSASRSEIFNGVDLYFIFDIMIWMNPVRNSRNKNWIHKYKIITRNFTIISNWMNKVFIRKKREQAQQRGLLFFSCSELVEEKKQFIIKSINIPNREYFFVLKLSFFSNRRSCHDSG